MGALAMILGGASARGASISSFSPVSGQPGNLITINGSGLSGTTLVQFNANNVTDADFIIVSDSKIETIVPFGATTGPLKLTVNGAAVTSASAFSAAPTVTGFAPASGQAGTPVAIFGANFVVGGTTVQFSGAAAVAGTVTSFSQVNAIVPSGATNGIVTVATAAGSGASAGDFVVSTAPVITDFSPTIGTNLTSVIIDGANFVAGGTIVKFNGTPSLSVTVSATTQLHATVPNGATTGPISVTVGNQTFTTKSNFVTASGLVATGFSPPYAKAGSAVTITGVGLSAATAVAFSNNVAATITGQSSSQLQVIVPTGAKNGPIKISWAGGNFNTTSNFTFLTGPLITDFAPTLGPVGTAVVIDGVNFTGATAVKFNGQPATSFAVTADTQITANVPSGGTGPVSVIGSGGTSTTLSNFIVTTTAPYLKGFNPPNAVRGAAITIDGANFANLASPAVRIAGAAASNAPVTATTQLTAYVPAGAQTGLISVQNAGGSGVSSSMLYLQPWITNFTPAKGWVYSNLTVVGRNFTNATAMTVGGAACDFSGTSGQIVAAVPTNATPGPLIITTPGGVVISTNTFVILPKIFSFSPAIGPPGTLVTLTGTSLQNVSEVQFGSLGSAKPKTTNFGQLTVVAPSNGITGPLTVYTPAGSDTSVSNFVETGLAVAILKKTADTEIAKPGEDVTYTLFLTNLGPSIMTSVVVTDALPAGLSFVSASGSAGTITYSNPVVYWRLPELTNQTAASATILTSAMTNAFLQNMAGVDFAEEFMSEGFFTATSGVYFISDTNRLLEITSEGSNEVVSWPLTGVDFQLQGAESVATTNWTPVSGAPRVVNGRNYLTNSPTLPERFYRLKAP